MRDPDGELQLNGKIEYVLHKAVQASKVLDLCPGNEAEGWCYYTDGGRRRTKDIVGLCRGPKWGTWRSRELLDVLEWGGVWTRITRSQTGRGHTQRLELERVQVFEEYREKEGGV